MNEGKTMNVIGESEVRVINDRQRIARECCGCPACPCGCNGPSVKTIREG